MDKTAKAVGTVLLISAFGSINAAGQIKDSTAALRRDTVTVDSAKIIRLRQDSIKVANSEREELEREEILEKIYQNWENVVNDSLDAFGIRVESHPRRFE